MDLGIINTFLLTFQGKGLGIIENGAIGIENDEIVFVGKTEDFDSRETEKIIDGRNHVTMPGLVNAHIHSGLTLLRGGAQDLPEIEWMNKGLGPLVRQMSKEDFIVGAQLGVLEGLKSGTTTFCEYATNVEALVENVYKPFNIRVVATETINETSKKRDHLKPTDLYDFDRSKGEAAFKRNRELVQKYQDDPLVECMFGPQALDMLSLELFQAIHAEAQETGAMIHMHLAQGKREEIQIKQRYGEQTSTVKVLAENQLLDEQLLAAHCHNTSPAEKKLLVSKGVKMVGCPKSISMIDGIVPPILEFQALGGKVGLGTDQAPGSGGHNLFSEMRTISLLTKIKEQNPTVLPAWELLQLATKGGAEVLRLSQQTGSLAVGKKADIITINLNALNLTPVVTRPFRTIIPNLAYSATGAEVENVIIAGKLLIEGREFKNIPVEKIIKEANRRAERIFREAEEDLKKANSFLMKKIREGKM